MLGDLTIREDEPPHHLGEYHLLSYVVPLVEHSRELEVVDRPTPLLLGERDQASAGLGWQREVMLEHVLEVRALLGGELTICVRDLE